MKIHTTALLALSLLTVGASLPAEQIPLAEGTAEVTVPGAEPVNFEFQYHRIDIEITGHEENVVRVETEPDQHEAFPSYLDWDAGKRNMRLSLGHNLAGNKVRIWLPIKSSINLQLVDSDILISGIKGNAIIHLVNGDIRMEGAAGAILMEMANGDSVVSPVASGSSEPISIMSQNGDIRLIVPKDFKASATVATIGGKVSCDVPGAAASETSTGRHVVNLGSMSRQTLPINGGGRPVILNTVNGDIRIEVR